MTETAMGILKKKVELTRSCKNLSCLGKRLLPRKSVLFAGTKLARRVFSPLARRVFSQFAVYKTKSTTVTPKLSVM